MEMSSWEAVMWWCQLDGDVLKMCHLEGYHVGKGVMFRCHLVGCHVEEWCYVDGVSCGVECHVERVSCGRGIMWKGCHVEE